ncbi:hypothetical protein PsorP6_017403 [Peronosclerospora sorghi]|uniref:Uncharacterized protein n=1 Tax=Peronosclerospora sorghi TaxID=230839 RepID=A0ACC0WKX8_9STRA|nr:hypothetical protein PsorP6_017403 [Peronosclerospora sorghi]
MYEFIAAPRMTSWSQSSLIKWITQKYYARASRMGSGDPVCKSELLFEEKKKRELVNQKTIDSDPTKNVKTTKMKLTMLCK